MLLRGLGIYWDAAAVPTRAADVAVPHPQRDWIARLSAPISNFDYPHGPRETL